MSGPNGEGNEPDIRRRDTRDVILDQAQQIVVRKGYAAVGISEVLSAAGVPKGSFYHWFASKDAFGEALVEHYFEGYLAEIDGIAARPVPAAERLVQYWQSFYDMQSADGCRGRCLVVKLGAEVSDLSEPMRRALVEGVDAVVARIGRMIVDGVVDGSVVVDSDPDDLARSCYGEWIGASVLSKITRRPESLDSAFAMTRRRLHI